MTGFRSPQESLKGLDAESASNLIAAASDIALVLDEDGVVRDLAVGSDDMRTEQCEGWIGKPLESIVAADSRPKVGELLAAAARDAQPRARHLNHTTSAGSDLPILYSAVRIGAHGPVLALGRDMRAMANLQQRLMDVQQSVERDYSKLRHLETRYRLLFQMASEAVVVVDGASRKVEEANPAATQLLGIEVGQTFPQGFDTAGTQAVHALLARVQALGRTDEARVRATREAEEFLVTASLFRQEGSGLFLIRLTPLTAGAPASAPRTTSRVLEVMNSAPDGFVITTPEGRILSVNNAFLELTQLATEEQARDESLDRWLGRPGVDLNVLMANLREHGSVRLFATTLRGEYGARENVEISAVAVPGEDGCMGFVIRSVSRRPQVGPSATGALPHSAEQLKELVGRMPLRELVRETTDMIERMCIEASLELTGDNRASAAEMLGLSRQSLYVKLRRYGLVDTEPDEAH